MEVICAYQDNEQLRRQFNGLARSTFGLDFEDWYQNGYWKGNYIPYSALVEGRLVANVSASPMVFCRDGRRQRFLQLGTVMTEEGYRGRGLIRRLMEAVEADFAGRVDGMFLFANDSVLDFYPKFGFEARRESQYECLRELPGQKQGRASARRMDMKDARVRRMLEESIRESACQSRFEMRDNVGLVMFYATKFMSQSVYYVEDDKAWALAEWEGGRLCLHAVFSPRQVEPERIAAALGADRGFLTGFVPLRAEGCRVSEWKQEDTTLFLKGPGFDRFEEEGLMFPTLSHA